jgi:hypothetical protein
LCKHCTTKVFNTLINGKMILLNVWGRKVFLKHRYVVVSLEQNRKLIKLRRRKLKAFMKNFIIIMKHCKDRVKIRNDNETSLVEFYNSSPC